MKKLDPKAVWLFFLQASLGWIILFAFLGLCFVLPLMLELVEDGNVNYFGPIFVFIGAVSLGVTLVFFLISYVYAKFAYENYRYELKEDGFYKESGVISKRYVTIPYEKIQNVDINRSLLSRILGLSDLQIQTAGMSAVYGQYGAYGMGAEGRLPAVSKSEALVIRDELVKRARGSKASV